MNEIRKMVVFPKTVKKCHKISMCPDTPRHFNSLRISMRCVSHKSHLAKNWNMLLADIVFPWPKNSHPKRELEEIPLAHLNRYIRRLVHFIFYWSINPIFAYTFPNNSIVVDIFVDVSTGVWGALTLVIETHSNRIN